MTAKVTKPIKKSSKTVAQSNVVITPRAQQYFVAAVALAWLSSGGMTAYYAVRSSDFASLSYLWYQLGYVVFPLLLFVVAWWYVGKIGTSLARLFKSLLITVAALILFYAAYSMAIPLLFRNWGPDPGWWSRYGMEVIMYGTFTALYVTTLIGVKLRRNRG